MFKRFISLLVAVIVTAGIIMEIPVSAQTVPEKFKEDYVAGDDGNLITTYPTSGNLDVNSVDVSAVVSGSTAVITAKNGCNGSSQWGLQGFLLNDKFISTDDGYTPEFTKGTKMLFGGRVKKAAESTSNAKINIVYASYGHQKWCYPDDYPTNADGFELKHTEWTDFNTVITAPANMGGKYWSLIVGMSAGTLAGAKVEIDISSMYVGEEIAHDIDVTSDKTEAMVDSEFEVKAEIVNQLDDKFSGEQGDFSWYALTDDREAFASGIDIKNNGDGTAKVSIAPYVKAGVYDIVAVSDMYEDFVKGVEIEVVSFPEYIPGKMPDNLITDVATALGTNSNSTEVRYSSTDDYVLLTANKDIPDVGSTWPYHGTTVSGSGLPRQSIPKNTNMVFSAQVKSLTKDKSVIASVGLYRAERTPLYSREYPSDSEGMLLEESDWKTLSASFTIPANSSEFVYDKYAYPVIGMAEGTQQGAKLAINKASDSMYLGVEEIYDITVKPVDTSVVDVGKESTVTYKAQIVNQVGIEGTIEQGSFVWRVMNEDKTAFEDSVKITANDDNTATVTVGKNTPVGIYKIIAVSEKYPEFIRSYPLTVTDGSIRHSIYVSPEGNDENTGTFTLPLKTVEAAQELAREYIKEGKEPLEVVFRAGDYYFEKSLDFFQKDSGVDNYPVTYRAYSNEKVRFKGSKLLDLTKAKKVTDKDVLSRIRDGFKSEICVIDLSEQGIKESQICTPAEGSSIQKLDYNREFNGFYINGKSQNVSCWPNGGDEASYTFTPSDSINKFTYTDVEPDRWKNAKNWWVNIFNMYDFIPLRLKVVSIDTENNVIYTGNNGGVLDVTIANPYTPTWKAYNLLEEIDVPGEYHIDVENMKLYFLPSCDLEGAVAELDVIGDPVIELHNAKNITFSGIEFSQINDDGVLMTNVNNIDVIGCTFSNIGFRGLAVVGTHEPKTIQYSTGDKFPYGASVGEAPTANDASYNMDIKDNIFYNIGSSAIHINGGNIDNLIPSDNVVENNLINKISQNVWWDGIVVAGVGTKVRNNNISDSPYYAIRSYGNDHIIEYNEVYDVIKNSNDAAAIYSGASQIARGTTVQYNYIHHLKNWKKTKNDWVRGIYFDDCQQGHIARYNIVTDVVGAFNSNGAGDYHFDGNTVINTDLGANFSFNVGAVPDSDSEGIAALESRIANPEIYYEKYPALLDLINGANPKKSSTVSGNVFANVTDHFKFSDYRVPGRYVSKEMHQEKDVAFSENETVEMSVFVNPDAQDYRIKSEYASKYPYALNESFDIEKIGMTTNYVLDENASPFALTYPANKARGIPVDKLWLSWEGAFGASKYKLTVAKDALFSEVIYDDIVPYNAFEITNVAELSLNTTYYWKVAAINPSRDFGSTWQSDVYSFTTVGTDIINLAFSEGNMTAEITAYGGNVPLNGEAVCYMASYDEDGKMLECVIDEITIKENEIYHFSNTFTNYIKEKTFSVKLYMWDKYGTPLSSYAIYTTH